MDPDRGVSAASSRGEEDTLSSAAISRLKLSHEVPDRIRTKNRRKRYLDLHPEYFGPQLELADPLLYDRLIRRFQSNAEREAEGRAKGYSGVLEADLWRGEAKLNALRHQDEENETTYRRGENGEILAEEKDEIPLDKEEGLQRWKDEMERRFLGGRDGEIDYASIDSDPAYDDTKLEEQEEEDRYFDSETPEWMAENGYRNGGTHSLSGETGIQDF